MYEALRYALDLAEAPAVLYAADRTLFELHEVLSQGAGLVGENVVNLPEFVA